MSVAIYSNNRKIGLEIAIILNKISGKKTKENSSSLSFTKKHPHLQLRLIIASKIILEPIFTECVIPSTVALT